LSYLSGTNNLKYTHDVDRTVKVASLEYSYDFRARAVDVGAALGPNVFFAPDDRQFTRLSLEPRVTFKLFELWRNQRSRYLGKASFRAGYLVFFDGFNADDFGATRGSYDSGGAEGGLSFRFVIDFDRYPYKRK
jgi:hypothetical protein